MKQSAPPKAPPRPPSAAEQTLQQAMAALQSGRPDEAEWLAGSVLKSNAGDPRALHVLGYALLLQGRAQDAIAPLEQVARRTHDPAIETQLAMALRQAGRTEEALERLARASKRRPPFSPAFLEYGNLLAALGRNDEAIGVLKHGLELAPRMGQLAIQIGFIHAARNERAEARAMLVRGLADAPGDTDGLFQLARMLQNECDFAQAAEIYRRLLAIAPHDAAARVGLGACLLELGETDAAFDSLQVAAGASAKIYGEIVTAVAASGRGRFWLRPSDAARALKRDTK